MVQEEHARKSRFSVLTQQYYLTNILAEVTYSDLLSRMKDNDSNKKTGVYLYNEGNVEYSILDTTLKMTITLQNGQIFSKNYSVELRGKEVAD